jgi:hypothetical protein
MKQFRWEACPPFCRKNIQAKKSIRKETLSEHIMEEKKKKYRIHLLLIHGQNLHDEQLLAVVQHLDSCPCHCSECQEVVVMFFSLDVLS